MEFVSVQSSNIRGVFYSAESQSLFVDFPNGSVYQYSNVGQDEYDDFMASASKGQYFNDNIKNSYPYARV